MRQNMINTLSIERPTTQQSLNNQQHNCNQCISSAMFMGLESKSSWQVDIHPSTYIMEEDPINKDKEDQCALTCAYVQVEELHNNIKKKEQACFNRVEIPSQCMENKGSTPNPSSSSAPLHITEVPLTTTLSTTPKVSSPKSQDPHPPTRCQALHNHNISTKSPWTTPQLPRSFWNDY
ncbi:hypothetical protein ID866_7252 [Astraeus odoratus]|nr:hypothetical protein ID866_7252 [Astraeus odoratus]